MTERIINSVDEYNDYVKKKVEEKFNLQNIQNSRIRKCLCSNEKSDSFYYHADKGGIYKCFSGTCGLNKSEGNYHTLNEEFKIVDKKNLQFGEKKTKQKKELTPTYIYRLENGQNHYGIMRFDFTEDTGKPKKIVYPAIFKDNKWHEIKTKNPEYETLSKEYKNLRKVLYNLDKFKSIKTLWIVEGEKCADRLNNEFAKKNLSSIHLATTNVGGATKWINDYNIDILENENIDKIIIIPDYDKAGFEHARLVYSNLEKKALVILPEEIEYQQDIYDVLENNPKYIDVLLNHANRYDLQENFSLDFLSENYEFVEPEITIENKEYELNEVSLAERFCDLFHKDIKYVQGLDWHIWNGTYWEHTEKGLKVVKKVISAITEYVNDTKKFDDKKKISSYMSFYKSSMRNSSIENILKLAKSDFRIYVKSDLLNHKDYLLNVKNGVVDLKTGYLLPHKREYYFTKVIDVSYPTINHGLPFNCPTWNDFLKFAFMERTDLIEYIQMMIGYSLSGSVSEQAVFFMTGVGKNGKSTFIEVIQLLLGGYYRKLNSDSLMDKKIKSSINNDIASLHDSRLCVASEIEEGSMWNQSLIKDLSGGDEISARFLRQEFFIFKPKFKLWIYGNYKPYLKGLDEGTKRRFRIIPFDNVVIKENNNLKNELIDELPSILAWAVEGSVKYFTLKKKNHKINLPDAVTIANEEYFRENDQLIEFLEEFFDSNSYYVDSLDDYISKKDFYKKYREYADEVGMKPYTEKSFSRKIREHHKFKESVKKDISGKAFRCFVDLKKVAQKFKNMSDNSDK